MGLKPEKFNIRVYGIWVQNDRVMLCHEKSGDFEFNKFPGGGLELGEGIYDCLQREFEEELGIIPEIQGVFYINKGLMISAFNSSEQLISIYLKVQCEEVPSLQEIQETKWNQPYTVQPFWYPLQSLTPKMFYFPLDKEVCQLLKIKD